MQWFDVDRQGLAQILARRGKQFIVYELVANAWDQNVTCVDVKLLKAPGDRYVTVSVEDDDPEGFRNLSHAFTLFAASDKKTDAGKRGRFNLGEKLVLALCDSAEIITTTGGLLFDATGRHQLRRKRIAGSLFVGRIKMTNAEYDECVAAMACLIPPPGIQTTFSSNDTAITLPIRSEVAAFEAALPTETADADGLLRRTVHRTKITVYEPQFGEIGTLYEMGIPVVETGDRYHVDIGQKVPLTFDRDNVPPAYLRDVRTLVLNEVHDRITDSETANTAWVRDALADQNVTPDAVTGMIQLRFGKAVAYDPSDAEANKRAVAAGYTVVHGSNLSKAEWANVRRAGALPAAGKVTPSPKPYSDDPNAPPVQVIAWAAMSEAEQRVVITIRRIARTLLGFEPEVRVVSTSNNFAACYGSRCLDLNRRWLGLKWFTVSAEAGRISEPALDLLIHELGHQFSGDHLSDQYYNALTRLGAKLTLAVADQGAGLLVV